LILILFQKEIREFFEKNNFTDLLLVFRKKNKHSYDEDHIKNLSNAVINLANKKIGAFICIEGRNSIEEYTSQAQHINAEVSASLLESIFAKHSPLHDGSVIIKDNLITYAATFFPIDVELNIDSKYGTRHRAALTISHLKDVIAIIVSEETGQISIAYEGILYSDLNFESLYLFISEKMNISKLKTSEEE